MLDGGTKPFRTSDNGEKTRREQWPRHIIIVVMNFVPVHRQSGANIVSVAPDKQRRQKDSLKEQKRQMSYSSPTPSV